VKRILPFALAVTLFFAASAAGAVTLRRLAKPLPALVLAIAVITSGRGVFRRGVLVGLLCSAGGDVLLDRGLFLPGLGAFFAAHVAYVIAFVSDSRTPALLRALPFAGWGALLFARIRPGLGALTVPVVFYVAAICTMMWRAAARVGPGPGPRGARAGLVGAVSFGLSDSLIAWDRFFAPIPRVSVPIMLLYWLGQAGIAIAAIDEEAV
jgi:alkenylglycerophosphocholine/alkenylglycerophosphoethanolamine hydrolase